jgi:hypothetical protein
LAQVGGTLMGKYVNDLLPILLDILNDASSSQKREVSLWTLAQLVESTGAVVTPYSRYVLYFFAKKNTVLLLLTKHECYNIDDFFFELRAYLNKSRALMFRNFDFSRQIVGLQEKQLASNLGIQIF